MNNRHQKQMSCNLTTSSITLIRYLVDKSSQARKIVQWNFIEPILREARNLFVYATDMLDGRDTKDKALRCVYNIQKQSLLVCALERDMRKHKTKPNEEYRKLKKPYGFDEYACAYVDEMCDNIIAQICAYGQNHQPQNKG